MKDSIYPVPPPLNCSWYVYYSHDTERIVVNLSYNTPGAHRPEGRSTVRPSRDAKKNRKRILDKMVVMRLDYERERDKRRAEQDALEGLLGEFK